MKIHRAVLFLLLIAALVASSCNSRAERTHGTVRLESTSFNGVPVSVPLSQTSSFQLTTVQLANILKDPSAVGASFQDIELRSYEVTYRRRDTGTRLPPALSARIFGTVPAGGTG